MGAISYQKLLYANLLIITDAQLTDKKLSFILYLYARDAFNIRVTDR